MLLLTCASAATAQNKTTLVLWHADGTSTDIALYLMPKVEFQDDNIRIISTVLDMEFPVSEILRFTYKGGENSIDAPQNVASFSKTGEYLVFHGIKNIEQVSIYTITGVSIPAQIISVNDGVALILSSVPRGVFVLSVNGKNYKFSHS